MKKIQFLRFLFLSSFIFISIDSFAARNTCSIKEDFSSLGKMSLKSSESTPIELRKDIFLGSTPREVKDAQKALSEFGIKLTLLPQQDKIRISSRSSFLPSSTHLPFHLRLTTNLPVILDGESPYALTLVSQGAEIQRYWSSPCLRLLPSENFNSLLHSYSIWKDAVFEGETLSHQSGLFVNQGALLSQKGLYLEIIDGTLRNEGLIESQKEMSFAGAAWGKKNYFENSGKLIAPEINVGSLLKNFFQFSNQENHGFINSNQFVGQFVHFINRSKMIAPLRIKLEGTHFDNEKGEIHCGGHLSLDFIQVNNTSGNLSGVEKTEVTVRESLTNAQGEIGALSLTELKFTKGAQSPAIGKIQGSELSVRSLADLAPIQMKAGEFIGQKSISLTSSSKVELPQVHIRTPLLNLSVPDFALDPQKDCANTVIHCDPQRHFALTSPFCTEGKILFLQSEHSEPSSPKVLDRSSTESLPAQPSQALALTPQNAIHQRLLALREEVDQLGIYFKKNKGKVSHYRVDLRAHLQSSQQVQFITPLATIYIGDQSTEGTSEAGIDARSLHAWANFLFLINGHVAAQDALVSAPSGLSIGTLIEHPSDRVQVGSSEFPLLCRNSAVWATQNQTHIQGPLSCQGSMEIGGDLILDSERDQWSCAPQIRVQGDFALKGSGDFNVIRHVGQKFEFGSEPKYSVPASIRVEKQMIAEKPVKMRLYSSSFHADSCSGSLNLSGKTFESKKPIQFPGKAPEKIFRHTISSCKEGVMSLDGTDHHGLISSPQLYLIEKKGEFVLATKNPFYFDPKNPIQDLMQKGFELNTTYITPHLREALMQEADRRFHFTLRERFFFHSSESEQFYHDIQDHVMVLQPKQGLTRLQAGQTLFSLSPQLLLKKVQDACQENLMRGYIESNETINLEYLRQLHRNATQYLARLGVEWSNQNTSILNTSQFIAALNDPKNKKFLPQKPIIFYEKVINEQNLEELKPFIYLPPHLLEQARESQTGNVIATTLARFPNTMTPEDMLLALPEESSVRKQLSRFLENNPRTRRALTQAAHHAQREELESGSKTEDSMMLSFPIRALRYSLVSEGDIQLAADQEAESADLVSTKGSISIESTASRVQDGAHFHDSLTDRRSLKMRGHLELRAGQDIHLKAIQAHAGSFGAEAQGSVTDQPILLQSYSEKSSPGLQEKRFESRATPSEFDVQGQMRIRGHQMTLQGTHIQAEELQLKSDEQMRILGIIESEQTARSTEESTGALFWKGKRVKHESASHQRFRPAEFRVTRKVEIHGKEAVLEAPHLHAPETLIEADTARILQGKSTSETSDYKNSSNPFWVSMNASQQKHESHTPLQSSGHVKIKATKLEIEKVNGQVLDFLDHLEFNPSQVEVVHRQLSELHHRDHQSVSAPGPALVTAVAVTVSVLTAGSGTPVAAAVSAKLGAAIGSMTGAAVSAITSQVTTQVVLGVLSQSSPREMLKQLTSKDALKSLATSVVSAGALHCVQSVQAATHTSPFVCEIENAATQATVGAGIGLALGDQEFGDLLQGAGIQLVSQLGSSTVSRHIGRAFAHEESPIARGVHKAAHGVSAAAFAAGSALVLDQDVGKAATGAALGAMVSEIVADQLAKPLRDDVVQEKALQEAALGRSLSEQETQLIWRSKVADISKIARLTGSISGLLSGSHIGVSSASSAASTAINYNFEPTFERHWDDFWSTLHTTPDPMRTQASSVDPDLASATRLSEEKSFEGIGLEFAPDDAPLEESYPEDWIPLAGAGLRTTKILGGLTKKGLARVMCFPGDTPICMGGLGSKKIENIQVGDQVQSCDLRTDSCTTRSVTQVFRNTAHRLLVLSFQGKTLKTTDEHPFFVMGKGWVKASDLHIGDELRHILGQNVVLEKIDQEFGEFSVYNFEVEGLHNYYACDVLVHNCNEAPHAGRILRNEVGSVGTDVGQRISSQRAMRSTQALDSAGRILKKNPTSEELSWYANLTKKAGSIERAEVLSQEITVLSKELKFTETTAKRMETTGRFVPQEMLAEAIKTGTAVPDPQGVAGAMKYTIDMFKNGKKYELEVIFREADKTILHFLYK